MRTRTKLTTPPGSEPAPLADVELRETYSPGFALPTEPRYPGRLRPLLATLVAVGMIAALGWLGVRLAASGQSDDPSLQFVPDETATSTP